MGRRPRIDPDGGIHHVYTRGSNRWVLFHDDADRLRLLGALDLVCKRYSLEVLAFCLMDNHIHLAVRCPNGSLSDAMRDLKSIYAGWFRARHGSSGPIFEARFGSKIVTSFAQLRRLIRYIHRNAYAISPTLELAEYRWSSHAIYLGAKPAPSWMRIDIAKPLFADYRRDVERPDDRDAVQNRPPFGELASQSVHVPGTGTLPGLADILVAVAHAAGTDVADVHPSRRNGLIGVAAIVAHTYAGYTHSEIAQPFGYRTPSAARMAMQRAMDRLGERQDLQLVLEAARRRLWPEAA